MSEELVAWLRREIEHDLAQASYTASDGTGLDWHEQSSGVLVTGPGETGDAWSDTHALGDSRLTRFIAGHDPRAVIEDCGAKLRVLNLYGAAVKRREAERAGHAAWTRERARTWPDPALIPGLEAAVRLIACGYRHRNGWREDWEPSRSGLPAAPWERDWT